MEEVLSAIFAVGQKNLLQRSRCAFVEFSQTRSEIENERRIVLCVRSRVRACAYVRVCR